MTTHLRFKSTPHLRFKRAPHKGVFNQFHAINFF